MVLESASFSVAQNKSKGEFDFKHSRLISEDAAQLFAEGSWTDRRQAKIIPVLKSVLAAKSGPGFVASVAGAFGRCFPHY